MRPSNVEVERRGRVDAVIRIVLSRRFGSWTTAEDWCDVLDVTPAEVRAELDRRRNATRRPTLTVVDDRPRNAICPTCGKGHLDARGVASCQISHQPPIPCPVCGRPCNPRGLGVHIARTHPDHPKEPSP